MSNNFQWVQGVDSMKDRPLATRFARIIAISLDIASSLACLQIIFTFPALETIAGISLESGSAAILVIIEIWHFDIKYSLPEKVKNCSKIHHYTQGHAEICIFSKCCTAGFILLSDGFVLPSH